MTIVFKNKNYIQINDTLIKKDNIYGTRTAPIYGGSYGNAEYGVKIVVSYYPPSSSNVAVGGGSSSSLFSNSCGGDADISNSWLILEIKYFYDDYDNTQEEVMKLMVEDLKILNKWISED